MTKHIAQKNRTMATTVLVALLSGIVGGALYDRITPDSAGPGSVRGKVVEQRTYVEESSAIKAIEKVSPSVMSVVVSKDVQVGGVSDPFSFFESDPFFGPFFTPDERGQGQGTEPETRHQTIGGGTGFIVTSDGLALTNRHVVADVDAEYTAVLPGGREYEIEVIDRDPLNDLAVIQLHEKKEGEGFGDKPEGMPVAELGDSRSLRVGQQVIAIGFARAQYENSVTSGIVSALGRQIQASDGAGGGVETLSGLLQTDAAINPGNSGGPLISLAGQVIGVNTAIDSGASGIGFAIPIDDVKPVVKSVQEHGKIVRPMLGVRHIILSEDRAKELGLEGVTYGALLVGDRSKGEFAVTPGSAAEKADLKVDDVILEVNGERIDENNTLQSVIMHHSPGDELALTMWRSGKAFATKVTLGEFKAE